MSDTSPRDRRTVGAAVRANPAGTGGDSVSRAGTCKVAGDKGDPHADQPHSGLLLITVSRVPDATWNTLEDCDEAARSVPATWASPPRRARPNQRRHRRRRSRCGPGRPLGRGVPLLDEPGLPRLLESGLNRQTLRFSTDFAMLADRDVVFVCVPTPSRSDGSADLTAADAAVGELAAALRPGAVLALKSTVPVGTTRRVAQRLRGTGIRAVANPEFLRESHAVYDFRHPTGSGSVPMTTMRPTDESFYANRANPMLRMSPESAELAKYASNVFFALKIS